ncbi:BLUF domain-containing protein [Pyruvatibacter sp.]|uniref:BLUF domain-containing protein n=1 Tax=Pyruvatibacter sp. TaxID=1981328 RepID=UPI0032EE8C66
MAFCQLAYVSNVAAPYAPDELSALVACARRNNVRDDITGLLLAGRGGFVQVVEGPHAQIHSLIDRLESDYRHTNMVLLQKRDVHLRAFADTPLAVRQADADSLRRLEQALPVLASGLCSQLTAEAVGLVY